MERSERYWRHPDGYAVGVEITMAEIDAAGNVFTSVSGRMPDGYETISKATYDAEITARDAYSGDALTEAVALDAAAIAERRETDFATLVNSGIEPAAATIITGHAL